jgi:formylglycine-generating enzyme required for sulfatase activity
MYSYRVRLLRSVEAELKLSLGSLIAVDLLRSWDLPTFMDIAGTIEESSVREWRIVFDPNGPRTRRSTGRPELAGRRLRSLQQAGRLEHLRDVFSEHTLGQRKARDFRPDFDSGYCMLPPWADGEKTGGLSLGVSDLIRSRVSLLILGDMGSGKSTLLRLFIRDFLLRDLASHAETVVLVNLRGCARILSERVSHGPLLLQDLLESAVAGPVPEGALVGEAGLLAVDGFDEISVVLPKQAARVVEIAVMDLIEEVSTSGVPVLLTSRPRRSPVATDSFLLPVEVAPLLLPEAAKVVQIQQPKLPSNVDITGILEQVPADLSVSPFFVAVVAVLLESGELPNQPSRWSIMRAGLRELLEARLLRRSGSSSLEHYIRCSYDTLIAVLGELAFGALSGDVSHGNNLTIPRSLLMSALVERDESVDVTRALAALGQDSGLLRTDGDAIQFSHRAYQEALGTLHLLEPLEFATSRRAIINGLMRRPEAMRGVALMYVDALAETGRENDLMDLCDALVVEAESDPSGRPHGTLIWMSAHIVGVLRGRGYAWSRRDRMTLQALVQPASAIVGQVGACPLADRVEIADELARLGDPRPGVGISATGLPDIAWCRIASGPYELGLTAEQFADLTARGYAQAIREQPLASSPLRAFEIAKYPITWAQYLSFVTASDGYLDDRWWSFAAPRLAEDPAQRVAELTRRAVAATEPARQIDWFESVAFTRWLSYRLGQSVTLPSEEEWEASARSWSKGLYPWEGRFSGELLNWEGSRLGRVIPVGAFASGDCGSEALPSDMMGNVWEWTLSIAGDAGSGDFAVLGAASCELDVAIDVRRVVRGCCYLNGVGMLRATYRGSDSASCRFERQGFRVVRHAP